MLLNTWREIAIFIAGFIVGCGWILYLVWKDAKRESKEQYKEITIGSKHF